MTSDTSTSTSPPSLRVGSVVVPLVGSDFARHAIPTARVPTERLDAELHAISVVGVDEGQRPDTVGSGGLS